MGTWTSRDAEGNTGGPLDARTTREVVIKAKRVIVSTGTLNSPLLLRRSGLTVSDSLSLALYFSFSLYHSGTRR